MTLLVATRPNLNLRVKEADGTPDVPGVSVVVVSNGTLTNDGGGQVTLNTSGGSTLPVVDTTAIVKGSVDDTKLVRLEVDGLTAGTTRVLTVPDTDMTLAGRDVANMFTVAQKINVNSATALFVEQDGVKDNVLVVDTTNGRVGINVVPDKPLRVRGAMALDNSKYLYAQRNPSNYQEIFGLDDQNNIVINRNSIVNGIEPDAPKAAAGIIYGIGAAKTLTYRNSNNNYLFSIDEASRRIAVLNGQGTTIPTSMKFEVYDYTAVNNGVSNTIGISILPSALPTNGFGGAFRAGIRTSTGDDTSAARIKFFWANVTHASRLAQVDITAYDFNGERTGLSISANGTAATIGVLGATPIARQAHIIDADGTLADITTKFNALLAYLENFGFIATS